MERKSTNKTRLVSIIVAALLGFLYYYLIFVHYDIQALNPHLVFFMLMIIMYIVALFFQKVYFIVVLTLVATVCYLFAETSLMNYIEQLRLMLGL